jgi:uncharacterized protein YkwD
MKEKIILLLFMLLILGLYYEYREGIIAQFLNQLIYETPMIEIKPNVSEPNYTVETNLLELEAEVQSLVNEQRINHSLNPLVWNEDIAIVARFHSEDMMTRGFFQHINPEGLDSQDRLQREAIYYFNKTGENLYRLITEVNQSIVARKAVDGWMGSSGHREIILDGDFNEAGVGIACSNETDYYITHDFITRTDCGYKGGPCCPSKPGYLPSCYVPYECVSGVCE